MYGLRQEGGGIFDFFFFSLAHYTLFFLSGWRRYARISRDTTYTSALDNTRPKWDTHKLNCKRQTLCTTSLVASTNILAELVYESRRCWVTRGQRITCAMGGGFFFFFFPFLAVCSIPIVLAYVRVWNWLLVRNIGYIYIHRIFINIKRKKHQAAFWMLLFFFSSFFFFFFSQIKWSFVLSIYMYIYFCYIMLFGHHT